MMRIDVGKVSVFTYKEGLLSRLAHDLELDMSRGFEIDVSADDVRAAFHPGSATVAGAVNEGVVDPARLSEKDKAEILENMCSKKILWTERNPVIRFEGAFVERSESHAVVDGDLWLAGTCRPVQVRVRAEGGRLRSSFELVPSRWGVKPFSAALGAIRLKDRVRVELDLADPRG